VTQAVEVFNHIVVTGSNLVTAEAIQEDGPFSVHGEHGQVVQRLTIARPLTVEQAQRIAEAVLARGEGYDSPGISDDEILALVA
jgi:hypothetical protein